MKNAIGTMGHLAAICGRLRTLAESFVGNRRGNVAMITALTAIPLVSAVGCAIDYSYASMIKTKLQAAADAATLGTVSNNSPVVTTAKAMTGSGTVSGGSTYAQNFFTSDSSAFSGVTNTETVSKSGMTVTATLNYSYSVPTFFMRVIPGYNNITVSGSSTASFTLPTYINFYLMLDVSGSMSFPSTPSEQAKLMAVNPDNNLGNPGYPQGCQFACHFQAQGACAQTGPACLPRSDPRSWVTVTRLQAQPFAGRILPGICHFPSGNNAISFSSGTNATEWRQRKLDQHAGFILLDCRNYVLHPITSRCRRLWCQRAAAASNHDGGLHRHLQSIPDRIVSVHSMAVHLQRRKQQFLLGRPDQQLRHRKHDRQLLPRTLASLLDTGQNATLGSGGTHFENALPEMNTFITSIGTGTSPSNALPYVFIVTDGSQDYQYQSGGSWGSENYSASTNVPNQNSATTLPQNPSTGARNDQTTGPNATDWCGTMKARGITIAILYIPYQPIADASTIFDDEDGYANTNVGYPSGTDYIPPALQSCASPNFFYTATSPAAITADLQAMFQQSLSTAHIAQ